MIYTELTKKAMKICFKVKKNKWTNRDFRTFFTPTTCRTNGRRNFYRVRAFTRRRGR